MSISINSALSQANSNVGELLNAYSTASKGLDTAMDDFGKAAAAGNEEAMMKLQQGIQARQRIMAAIQEMLKMIHQNAMEIIKNLSGR